MLSELLNNIDYETAERRFGPTLKGDAVATGSIIVEGGSGTVNVISFDTSQQVVLALADRIREVAEDESRKTILVLQNTGELGETDGFIQLGTKEIYWKEM